MLLASLRSDFGRFAENHLPAFSKLRSGQVELEVPWRELTKTRTARRSDLIRLLEPVVSLPSIEILNSSIKVELLEIETQEFDEQIGPNTTKGVEAFIDVKIALYISCKDSELVVIPFHRCQLKLNFGSDVVTMWKTFILEPPTLHIYGQSPNIDSITIRSTSTELIVQNGGRIDVRAGSILQGDIPDESVHLELKLLPVNRNAPIVLTLTLIPVKIHPEEDDILGRWELNPDNVND